MYGTPQRPDRLPTEQLARSAGVVALAGLALIHMLDLRDTLDEAPLIGIAFMALMAAAVAGAVALMTLHGPRVWALTDLIAAGAFVAYVLSRTSGLPTDNKDVGNWDCSLGIAALTTETLLLLLASWRLAPRRRPGDIGSATRFAPARIPASAEAAE